MEAEYLILATVLRVLPHINAGFQTLKRAMAGRHLSRRQPGCCMLLT
jgi:hypothetical protein